MPRATRKVTREEFIEILENPKLRVTLTGDVEILPCTCGDVNCLGWRLAPKGAR